MGRQPLTRDIVSEAYEDGFEDLNVKNWRNNLDIASHYNFSPERLRLFLNGSREFVQYGENDGAKFEDKADVWTLQPASGDTMRLESAESTSYVVNYVSQASFAFQINQSLQSGDIIKIGPFDGSDGWYLEQRGADHTVSQADIIQESAGSTTTLASDVELSKPITDWTRLEVKYNWYGVGNQSWVQTYTEDGEQFNDELVKTSVDGTRGPETGNLPLRLEVTAGSGTSGLELDAGSIAFNTLGDTTALSRDKPQRIEVTLDDTNDVWLPIYALRTDPDDDNVNVNFTSLDLVSYGNNTDLELVAASVSPEKTDASGSNFSVPKYHHKQNSALQDTTSISEVPASGGTQKVLGSADKFGGYAIAAAQIESGGNTIATDGTRNDSVREKKSILKSDHVVFLARTSNGGATLRFVWDADQNW